MKRTMIILISIVSVLFLCSCPPIDRDRDEEEEPKPANLSRGKYIYDDLENSYYWLKYSNSDYNEIRSEIYNSSKLDRSYYNIDEIVNNFNYTYNGMNKDNDFEIIPNIVEAPWNEKSHLVTLAVQSKQTEIDNTAGNNYVFLIGETFFFGTEYDDPMYGEKLTNEYIIFKNSFIKFLNNWNNPNDKISIIAGKSNAGTAKLICDGVQIDQKEKIINALQNIKNYNYPLSTTYNEKEFIYNVVDKNYIENGNNHLICMRYYLESRFPDSPENNDNSTKQYYYSSLICNNRLQSNANNVLTDCPNDYLNGGIYYFSNGDELDNIFNNGFRKASVKLGKNVKFSVDFNEDVVEDYQKIGYSSKSMSKEEYDQLPTPKDVFTYSNTTVMYLYEVKLKEGVDTNADILTAKVFYEDIEDGLYKECLKSLKISQIGDIPFEDYDFIVYAVEMGLFINQSKLLKYENRRTMIVTLITNSRNFEQRKKDIYMVEFASLMAKAIALNLIIDYEY